MRSGLLRERLNKKNTHGTGCTLSSAITSHLALGYDIAEAVKLSKEYITEAIAHSFDMIQHRIFLYTEFQSQVCIFYGIIKILIF